MPTPTKDMSLFAESTAFEGGNSVEGNSIIVDATTAENLFAITVVLKATDKDGNPVRNANVILIRLGEAALSTTNAEGSATLTTPDNAKVRLDPNQNEGTMDLKKYNVKNFNPELTPGKAEGYIKLKVMREGYRDFTSDYFLKIIRS